MNIVLLGPPGCGKGTQAQRICEHYRLEYISTGNMIREEIAQNTSIGQKAKKLAEQGLLLDDETVLALVKKELNHKKDGILLDGFPRTLYQAQQLDTFEQITVVLDIEVSDEKVINRIAHRFMVEANHHQYTFQSEQDAKDFAQKNNGKVFHRKDDTPQVVKRRLDIYHNDTEPIIKYYQSQKKLIAINGEQSIDAVWQDIKDALSPL